MHIDLSNLPPLIQPSPPSNTLLITQLSNPSIFLPSTLSQIKTLLSQHASSAIHTFSPLKSMRRIIVSFPSTEAAISLRRILDGEEIYGCRVRVYFGVDTPVALPEKERFLAAPDAGKLFFISPPPSPPAGWTMRNEDPPNRLVHAEDLVSALGRLRDSSAWSGMTPPPPHAMDENGDGDGVAAADIMDEEADVSAADVAARRGSIGMALGANTTVVFHPDDHGIYSGLPAVMVEDVSDDQQTKLDAEGKRILSHTARPPVELMAMDQEMDMS